MSTKETKLKRYLQDKMLPKIADANRMNDKCLFTEQDLAEAYSKGYDEGLKEKEAYQELIAKLKEENFTLSMLLNGY